jgi:hypothetical protein
MERLERQATFKFRAFWSVRGGKGLKHYLNHLPKMYAYGEDVLVHPYIFIPGTAG